MLENQELELKREYTDEIKRTVIAFLNTNDGNIYIGVDDNGVTVGVDDADDVMKKLSQSIKNSIRPDCSQFYNIKAIEKDEKTIVQVSVVKGFHRPYYLGEKGLKPSGVFVRVGSTTVQAQEERIRELVKRDDGDDYENQVSAIQSLTFNFANAIFEDGGIDFSDNKKRTLGLINADGFYTNMARLLSDQCEHGIKCAIFEGKTKEVFKDRKEFSGSLFKQIEDVLGYLNVYNRIESTIGQKTRTDKREYSETVLREAVLNAVIHRDYAFSGSILISLYDDRLEIMSLGSLVDGLSKDTIMVGISQTRNKKLADVFYRLKYVEAYGTGIPRIMENYNGMNHHPEITLFDNAFQICIPNKLYIGVDTNSAQGETLLETQTRKILNKLKELPNITKEDASCVLGVQPARAYVVLELLLKYGVLKADKMGKKKIYTKISNS